MGFDGIRDMRPQQRFPNMSIGGSTDHWIVWDSVQIKSKENEGTFNPGSGEYSKGMAVIQSGH